MANGPGRYDDLCAYARKRAAAAISIVIIVGGKRGDGFSVQMDAARVPSADPGITVRLLRKMADQIEQEHLRFQAELDAGDKENN